MEQIIFDPSGGPLWLSVRILGKLEYSYSYTYILLAADDEPGPRILTDPQVDGNADDCIPIANSFNPGEPLSCFHQRIIKVSCGILVTSPGDDNGYQFRLAVCQGKDCSGRELGEVLSESDRLGVASADLFFKFQLLQQ